WGVFEKHKSASPKAIPYLFTHKLFRRAKNFIEWIYVPAVKDASSEQDENSKSALGQLLARTIRAKVDFREPINELKSEAIRRYQEIIDSQNSILEEISTSLQDKLRDWTSPSANLDLKWHRDDEKSIKIEEPTARIRIGEGSFLGEVARLGHGMQRAFLLTILQELAKGDQERNPKLLLAIEEPELYQHPPQARHMARLLEYLSQDGKSNSQIILTTHSPYFVSCESFPNIRMVRKDYSHEVSQVAGSNYDFLEKRISSAMDRKPENPSSLMARVGQIMHPSQNELFFSAIPILVEGTEDVAFLASQLELSNQVDEFKFYGCHFVVSGGKTNMSRLLGIALELRMPVFIIFDADGNEKNADERTNHEKNNKCLLRMMNVDGSQPFPSNALYSSQVIMWPDNIARSVKTDFGLEVWTTAMNQAVNTKGLHGVRQKNSFLISGILEILFNQKKQSQTLLNATSGILSYARKIRPQN
ncbi:MAG: ATP-binding protein, partial [Sedimentisphaerales bacterium]|nr:ATP-binding protein [Sedimentisphaerales bacterium]